MELLHFSAFESSTSLFCHSHFPAIIIPNDFLSHVCFISHLSQMIFYPYHGLYQKLGFLSCFVSLLFSPLLFFLSKHGLRQYHDGALIIFLFEDVIQKTQCSSASSAPIQVSWNLGSDDQLGSDVCHPHSLQPGRTQNQNLLVDSTGKYVN